MNPHPLGKKRNPRTCRFEDFGGAYWTRTSDPIDVNDVLYQLSQSTKDLCEPILAFDLCVTFTERFASDQAIAGSFGASLETANISIAQQTGHVKRNLWVETK